MPFINTSRGRFFYREVTGDHPTLVFLHGNLGTSYWWRPTMQRLPFGWRGIAYDAIGFGYSPSSGRLDSYAISSQVADLHSLIQALTDHPVHIVAHSTATAAAIDYALAFPENIASLVLVGPVPVSGTRTPEEAYPILEKLPTDQQLIVQSVRAIAPTLPIPSAEADRYISDCQRTTGMALVAVTRALDSWIPGDRLKQLVLPVLLVHGEEDIMVSLDEAQRNLLSIPGANNLERMRGVGHSPMIENPDAFARVLLRFLAEDWESYEDVRGRADDI